MMRKQPYGANYLNWDDMAELKEAIDRQVLFRYQSSDESISDRLEQHVCKRFECKFALATHSCTQGSRLAILSTQPKIGDKVYIPVVSFVAVADAVLSCGLIPVLVDVDENFGLDFKKLPSTAERVISVSLDGKAGQIPTNIPYLIEDVAQSLGAKYPDGRYVGTVGHSGVFSFHHNKVLTSGVGGVVVTNNKEAFDLIRNYHDHGSSRKQGEYLTWNERSCYGENLISSELISAVQLQQFRHLDALLCRLNDEYEIYRAEFTNFRNCTVVERTAGDLKTTLRLSFDTVELKEKAQERILEKKLPLWTLDRYFLPDHPTLLHKNSIYSDRFPWNLTSEQLWDRADFVETKQRLSRIICLPISAHINENMRNEEIACYKNIMGDL